jgi:hypothetical protein
MTVRGGAAPDGHRTAAHAWGVIVATCEVVGLLFAVMHRQRADADSPASAADLEACALAPTSLESGRFPTTKPHRIFG